MMNKKLCKCCNKELNAQWILITECAPKYGAEVLVSSENGCVFMAHYDSDKFWRESGTDDLVLNEIIYWMPIPNLPEKENDD